MNIREVKLKDKQYSLKTVDDRQWIMDKLNEVMGSLENHG